jgi:hypothetical protein
MLHLNSLRIATVGFALAVAATAAPLVSSAADRLLTDKDLKKVSGKVSDWYEAIAEGKGKMEAEADIREELGKLNGKNRKLKGTTLLASPEDLGAMIYLSNKFDRKQPKRGAGKVMERTVDNGARGTVEYALWSPAKYKAKSGPYPLIITLPEEGENPKAHISNRWVSGALRESTIIASPKMPGDSGKWSELEGLTAVMLTLRNVSEIYAIDFDRVFIGGRQLGGEAALAIANMFPSRFAGAFCWAGDAGDGIPVENLKHLPVLISGGGSKATAFEERAKEAGVEGVTLVASGGEDAIIEWMSALKRNSYPTSFSLIPGATFPTNAYWLQVPRLPDVAGVRVDVEVNREQNTITLTGAGLTEVTLYLSDAIVDMSKPVVVIANGKRYEDQFERSFRVFLDMLYAGKVDPGRVFVASKQYYLPDLSGGGESDG